MCACAHTCTPHHAHPATQQGSRSFSLPSRMGFCSLWFVCLFFSAQNGALVLPWFPPVSCTLVKPSALSCTDGLGVTDDHMCSWQRLAKLTPTNTAWLLLGIHPPEVIPCSSRYMRGCCSQTSLANTVQKPEISGVSTQEKEQGSADKGLRSTQLY